MSPILITPGVRIGPCSAPIQCGVTGEVAIRRAVEPVRVSWALGCCGHNQGTNVKEDKLCTVKVCSILIQNLSV